MFHPFVVTVLTISLAAVRTASAEVVAPAAVAGSHVVTGDTRLREILHTGISKSATFRALVETLDESDVIVYLLLQLGRPGLDAYLVHTVAVSGPFRYLRVVLSMRATNVELLELLAHELQHAVEVARAPQVRSNAQLVSLFEEIGFIARGSIRETLEAQVVQQRVRRELYARGQ